MLMDLPEAKFRKIILSGFIDSVTVGAAIKDILDINNDDDMKEITFRMYKRAPICIYINSGGGSVYDGLALVDVIKKSRTPIFTIAIGSAMSMAFWIFISGHQRFIGENATLMYHEISSGVSDKLEGISLEVNEIKRLQKSFDKDIVSNSAITQLQLNDYRKRKAEWYIGAKEAMKLELAEGYYDQMTDITVIA